MIKVSVIIPTYNRFFTLKRAVTSILAQTYEHFEIIVIDDGSTDNTKEIKELFPSIRYFYIENSGVSKARNYGVQKSCGEWIAFLDSDDEWMPKKLEKQIAVIQKEKCRIVHGEEVWIRNGKRVNQKLKHKKGAGDQFLNSLDLCLISPSAVMLDKKLLIEMQYFREDYPVCEDYDLWLKITSLHLVSFIEQPIIYKYGGHADQLSQKYFAMDYWRIKSIDWILKNRDLEDSKFKKAVEVLKKKSKILLTGYEKHNNLTNYDEIKHIMDQY